MKLRNRISLLAAGILAIGSLQGGDCAYARELPKTIDVTARYEFYIGAANKVLFPGQTGQIVLTSPVIEGVQMENDFVIYPTDENASVKINADGFWTARTPGATSVNLDYAFTSESLERLQAAFPEAEFIARTISSSPSLMVGEPSWRLYNPHSGEHFFTASEREKNYLTGCGWKDEDMSWLGWPSNYAAEEGNKRNYRPIYRMYNPNAGDHHYTADFSEAQYLEKNGWKNEGISGYSSNWIDSQKFRPEENKAVYRLYNPNARTGSHHYTIDKNEYEYLKNHGWNGEGIAWYVPNEDPQEFRTESSAE